VFVPYHLVAQTNYFKKLLNENSQILFCQQGVQLPYFVEDKIRLQNTRRRRRKRVQGLAVLLQKSEGRYQMN
jgi:hypothetical protein